MKDLVIFVRDGYQFLLEIKQEAGWLVGMGFHRQGHIYRISFLPELSSLHHPK